MMKPVNWAWFAEERNKFYWHGWLPVQLTEICYKGYYNLKMQQVPST